MPQLAPRHGAVPTTTDSNICHRCAYRPSSHVSSFSPTLWRWSTTKPTILSTAQPPLHLLMPPVGPPLCGAAGAKALAAALTFSSSCWPSSVPRLGSTRDHQPIHLSRTSLVSLGSL